VEVPTTPPHTIPKFTADLAIGVPYQNASGLSGSGAVDVLYGSFFNNGLVTTNRQHWTGDNIGFGGVAGAHLGFALY
jgi:hypothetical protein